MRIEAILLVGALASSSAASAAPSQDARPAVECRKLPAGKRLVKLNLKPNTDLNDLIAWISSVTCRQFVLPASLAAGKTVTVYSPMLITPEEAYRLFLDALDSMGLTVYPSGRFLRVIETEKAKTSPIPLVLPGEPR
jgi:general secretion pathway protein D